MLLFVRIELVTLYEWILLDLLRKKKKKPRRNDWFDKDEKSHTYYEKKGSQALKTLAQIQPAPIVAEILSAFHKTRNKNDNPEFEV